MAAELQREHLRRQATEHQPLKQGSAEASAPGIHAGNRRRQLALIPHQHQPPCPLVQGNQAGRLHRLRGLVDHNRAEPELMLLHQGRQLLVPGAHQARHHHIRRPQDTHGSLRALTRQLAPEPLLRRPLAAAAEQQLLLHLTHARRLLHKGFQALPAQRGGDSDSAADAHNLSRLV